MTPNPANKKPARPSPTNPKLASLLANALTQSKALHHWIDRPHLIYTLGEGTNMSFARFVTTGSSLAAFLGRLKGVVFSLLDDLGYRIPAHTVVPTLSPAQKFLKNQKPPLIVSTNKIIGHREEFSIAKTARQLKAASARALARYDWLLIEKWPALPEFTVFAFTDSDFIVFKNGRHLKTRLTKANQATIVELMEILRLQTAQISFHAPAFSAPWRQKAVFKRIHAFLDFELLAKAPVVQLKHSINSFLACPPASLAKPIPKIKTIPRQHKQKVRELLAQGLTVGSLHAGRLVISRRTFADELDRPAALYKNPLRTLREDPIIDIILTDQQPRHPIRRPAR